MLTCHIRDKDYEMLPNELGLPECELDGQLIIQVPVYHRPMLIPKCYLKGFSHYNFYPDLLPGNMLYSGIIEQRMQALMVQYARSCVGFNLVDIGACCGAYSVFGELHFNRIYSFEPAPGINDLLRANVDSKKVTVYPFALSKERGEVNTGKWGSWVIRLGEQADHTVKVPCFPLDEFNLNHPDIVKIDTEGWAENVFLGGEQTLGQAYVIFVELHTESELVAASRFFQSHGFQWQFITETHLIATRSPLSLPGKDKK